MHTRIRLTGLIGVSLLLAGILPGAVAQAANPVGVTLDGRSLQLNPAPLIRNDRTLVPLRGVFEAMGATATWHSEDQSVEITRGDAYVRIKIDSRLACLNVACTRAATLDVPPQLIDSRTYVPVRFVTQALGVAVSWDASRRQVLIDTAHSPAPIANPVAVTSVRAGQTISTPVTLQTSATTGAGVQFYLVDPASNKATIAAAGSDVAGSYTYTPDPTVSGPRLLVAAVTDSAGAVHYSDPVSVTLASNPQVTLNGADYMGTVSGPISFSADVNFSATSVRFTVLPQGRPAIDLGTVGPGEKVTWYPQISQNGYAQVEATAYDRSGTAYTSTAVPVVVASGYRTVLSGVAESDVLTGPTTLHLASNYGVESVKYILDGRVLGWGFNYAWKFGAEANGPHKLTVEVTDNQGTVRTIGPLNFSVKVTPTVQLTGVGPDQVVTGPLSLKVSANVPITSVAFYLDPGTAKEKLIGRVAAGQPVTWTPMGPNAGPHSIRAVATDAGGQSLTTDTVKFRVFLGKVYGPVALVPKADFKDLAIQLALPVYRETGISAALQVAQALLETGYGQSVPVDKYTGQLSYNLFGIKGTGPAGSVISNTWEEYGGVAYRVDAGFRAYHNVQEAFRDHAEILLVRPWYEPVRAVRGDPVQGAWALKRSGYATDSQYPIKLINIMKANNLFQLDQIDF